MQVSHSYSCIISSLSLLTISTRAFDKEAFCISGFISPHKIDICEDVEGGTLAGERFADGRLVGDTFEVVELVERLTLVDAVTI